MAPSTTNSPSSSSSSSSTITTTPTSNPNPNPNNSSSSNSNPMQSWWESISKARSSILSLSSLLSLPSLSSLADSDRPAASLLSSPSAYSAFSSSLISSPSSGSGQDPLSHWLYDTFLSSDPDLRLVVLSFIPLLSSLYLSRIFSSASSSVAGFESVLLAVYGSETRSRNGKPLTISVPDLAVPSLYHSPLKTSPRSQLSYNPTVGILSPPLEPQIAMKSTKRALVVGVALDCYFKKVSLMPARSKLDFCEFVVAWAGQNCSCRYELDDDDNDDGSNSNSDSNSSPCMSNFGEEDGGVGNGGLNLGSRGCRIPLPWEMMQPVLKILGHCLLGPGNGEEVRNAAAAAVRSIYARAVHELDSRAILASRSLIRLDKSGRKVARDANGMVMVGGIPSNPSTPSKPRKQEVLLASK